jgi:hypothetical protein
MLIVSVYTRAYSRLKGSDEPLITKLKTKLTSLHCDGKVVCELFNHLYWVDKWWVLLKKTYSTTTRNRNRHF